MNVEEVKKLLARETMRDVVLIGTVDEREDYYPAIVEIDEKNAKVTYDYFLLAECFAERFKKLNPEEEKEEYEYILEAFEHIDYNVIRALPHWGEHAPIVLEEDEE